MWKHIWRRDFVTMGRVTWPFRDAAVTGTLYDAQKCCELEVTQTEQGTPCQLRFQSGLELLGARPNRHDRCRFFLSRAADAPPRRFQAGAASAVTSETGEASVALTHLRACPPVLSSLCSRGGPIRAPGNKAKKSCFSPSLGFAWVSACTESDIWTQL